MAKKSGLFAYSNWDAVPVLAGCLHLAFVIGFYLAFPHLSWVESIVLGCIYAIAISWNINSVSHNFLHNPYFNSHVLNRIFSWIESMAIGFSQCFYTWVHHRHHSGNSDRPDEHGETLDWLSIYRHGEHGHPENPWKYVFLSFFRDDMGELYHSLKKQSVPNARFGIFELASFAAMVVIMAIFDWKAVLFMVPFYYLGNCLSSLNGYYLHFKGNPDMPLAWGVSNYNRFYNMVWFNNGYHAEHHYRPKQHWTRMRDLHLQIKDAQRKAGVHVIDYCHALGFLDTKNRAN